LANDQFAEVAIFCDQNTTLAMRSREHVGV
jgi:hypothetical protein